jgi:hypothetical protein
MSLLVDFVWSGYSIVLLLWHWQIWATSCLLSLTGTLPELKVIQYVCQNMGTVFYLHSYVLRPVVYVSYYCKFVRRSQQFYTSVNNWQARMSIKSVNLLDWITVFNYIEIFELIRFICWSILVCFCVLAFYFKVLFRGFLEMDFVWC